MARAFYQIQFFMLYFHDAKKKEKKKFMLNHFTSLLTLDLW